MMMADAAAIVFAVLTGVAVVFQLALALGAPWGSYALGGAFPGSYPPLMRMAAVTQAVVLLAAALVVLARAGLVLDRWFNPSAWLVWMIAGLLAISFGLNVITPSAGERRIWAPLTFTLLVSALVVVLTA
jgi:hypothetical protein